MGKTLRKRSRNQGVKLMAIYDYLKKETRDDDHCVSAQKIADHLRDACDIPTNIKTVYHDLYILRECYDIKISYSAKQKGWYLSQRDFRPSDVRLLIDSIQSSRYLTQSEVENLTKQIRGLTDRFTATTLSSRKAIVPNRIKRADDSSIKNINSVSAAIAADSTISLKYYHYSNGSRGLEKRYVNNNKPFTLSPFTFYIDKGNYYVYAYDTRWRTSRMRFFRVDRMDDVIVNYGSPREGKTEFKEEDLIKKDSIIFNMYQGEKKRVQLKVANHLADAVVDVFGKSMLTMNADKDHFIFSANIQVSPTFYAWLFTFGDEIEILSPQEVREGMREHIKTVSALYK